MTLTSRPIGHASAARDRCADIAVLELAAVDLQLEDCQSQRRRVRQRLLPACWRAGARVAVTLGFRRLVALYHRASSSHRMY